VHEPFHLTPGKQSYSDLLSHATSIGFSSRRAQLPLAWTAALALLLCLDRRYKLLKIAHLAAQQVQLCISKSQRNHPPRDECPALRSAPFNIAADSPTPVIRLMNCGTRSNLNSNSILRVRECMHSPTWSPQLHSHSLTHSPPPLLPSSQTTFPERQDPNFHPKEPLLYHFLLRSPSTETSTSIYPAINDRTQGCPFT
jgi:hypothetical protein